MPEEEDGRWSSLSGLTLRERLEKEGTLEVFEIPTRRRIPGGGSVDESESGLIALDVNLAFFRSGGRNVKSSLTSAMWAE
jgi:hypothetical protein